MHPRARQPQPSQVTGPLWNFISSSWSQKGASGSRVTNSMKVSTTCSTYVSIDYNERFEYKIRVSIPRSDALGIISNSPRSASTLAKSGLVFAVVPLFCFHGRKLKNSEVFAISEHVSATILRRPVRRFPRDRVRDSVGRIFIADRARLVYKFRMETGQPNVDINTGQVGDGGWINRITSAKQFPLSRDATLRDVSRCLVATCN